MYCAVVQALSGGDASHDGLSGWICLRTGGANTPSAPIYPGSLLRIFRLSRPPTPPGLRVDFGLTELRDLPSYAATG